ncbi:hypothetical protein AZ002_003299, partial [Citrobacter freundii]
MFFRPGVEIRLGQRGNIVFPVFAFGAR